MNLIILLLIIIIVILSCRQREGFSIEKQVEFPPYYPEFTKNGRYIFPSKYLPYYPYWQPPNLKPQCIFKPQIDTDYEEILEKRKFF